MRSGWVEKNAMTLKEKSSTEEPSSGVEQLYI